MTESQNIPPEPFFQALMAGRTKTPPCAKTLGVTVISHDPATHTVELEFEGRPDFANPIGNVQGGFLAAMLDDAMGLASASAMSVEEFSPTLALTVHFHRPATIGKIQGTGRIAMRGRETVQLSGELRQNGKVVATATSAAIIRKV